MRSLIKKLDTKGFAHHFIIPVIAIVAIAGIGAYVVTRSKAATCTNATTCDYAIGSCSISGPSSVAVGTTISPRVTVKNIGSRTFTPKISWAASYPNYSTTSTSGTYTLASIAPGQSTYYGYGSIKPTSKMRGSTISYSAKSITTVSYSCSKKILVK